MEKDIKEIWKPVRGKEEYAEISNYGEIHYYGTGKGRYPDERWTYGSEDKNGYLRAKIGGITKGVHVWVYMTFNDCDVPQGLEVNHLDEDKHNNRLDNLNLLSHGDNMRYGTGIERSAAARRGRKQSPEHIAKRAAANSKAVQALDKNGNVVMEFPSAMEAQRQYGFDASTVAKCCRGKLKTHKGFIWQFMANKFV